MTNKRLTSVAVALAVVLSCASGAAWADRDRRDGHPGAGRSAPPPRGYVLDQRYQHNRYYPPRDYAIRKLPPAYRVVPHHGTKYYYHDGAWYRPSGSRFVVVLPPVGLVVPFLPPFYTTIWVGAIPYYYAGGVYYVWRPEERVYVVSEPPPEAEVSEQAAVPDQLFVYPTRGQSEQQQATDRYQCHRWASDQTGFDPTQPGGGVPEAQHTARRSDYQRAMKACLEARGYSVQ
jgi:hypothetical protein